jgi:hypothetical protein
MEGSSSDLVHFRIKGISQSPIPGRDTMMLSLDCLNAPPINFELEYDQLAPVATSIQWAIRMGTVYWANFTIVPAHSFHQSPDSVRHRALSAILKGQIVTSDDENAKPIT